MKYEHLIDTILIYEKDEEATLYNFLQDNLEELEAELFFIGFPNKIYVKSREWYNSLELKRRGRKYIDMDSITIQERYGQFKEISVKDIGLNNCPTNINI